MPVFPPYRNQSIDLLCKSIDWFLYESNTGILPKSRKPCKIVQEQNTLISAILYYLIAAAKNLFLEGRLGTMLRPHSILIFLLIFPYFLIFFSFGISRGNCETKSILLNIMSRFTCGESDFY